MCPRTLPTWGAKLSHGCAHMYSTHKHAAQTHTQTCCLLFNQRVQDPTELSCVCLHMTQTRTQTFTHTCALTHSHWTLTASAQLKSTDAVSSARWLSYTQPRFR